LLRNIVFINGDFTKYPFEGVRAYVYTGITLDLPVQVNEIAVFPGSGVAAIKANPKHGAVLKKLSDDDVAALATYAKGLAAGK